MTKANNADRNRRIIIQVAVAAVLIALVAAIGVSIAVQNASKDDDAAAQTPTGSSSVAAPAAPAATPTIAAGAAPNGVTGVITDSGAIRIGKPDAPVTVRVVADLQCPACKAFEAANKQTLEDAVNSGTAAVEYNIISFLDRASSGTKYSTRAANASYCVAAQDPSKYQGWIATMFDKQPKEGGKGLTDDELIAIAKSAGYSDEVADCIRNRPYDAFIAATTQKTFDGGVNSTPTVFVNNQQVSPSNLAQAIAAASGR
nr:thioredoxin domain-containing protein [Nocardia bovistercoris]